MDLDKPLHFKYLVNGRNFHIEYEELYMICFTCEKFGHIKECVEKAQSATAGGTSGDQDTKNQANPQEESQNGIKDRRIGRPNNKSKNNNSKDSNVWAMDGG
ncbi:hypothetical protein Ahy_A01g000574 [Arachis hypogaea]|uniref:CCHC-type domain-containing protein n=1 Tax=Arachis hypogaea TaxID=3818 RepID=A0A445EKJ8_ARAHY|nr:hypothetical protein Ahy_A01g000574 [Arachis hypogaea]